MQDLATQLAIRLGPILLDLLVALILAAVGAGIRYLLTRTKAAHNDYLTGLLTRLQGSVELGVRAGTQRLDDVWRRITADGVITRAELVELRDAAVAMARDAYGPAALAELERVIGADALQSTLETYAEAWIQRLRSESPVTIELELDRD